MGAGLQAVSQHQRSKNTQSGPVGKRDVFYAFPLQFDGKRIPEDCGFLAGSIQVTDWTVPRHTVVEFALEGPRGNSGIAVAS